MFLRKMRERLHHQPQRPPNSLCSTCSALDLPRMFREVKISNATPVQSRDLVDLHENAANCQLCGILSELSRHEEAVSVPKQNPKPEKCNLYLEGYGEIHSAKSGGRLPPEGITRYDAQVESVPRLNIRLATKTGQEMWHAYGLQLKAPTIQSRPTDRSCMLKGRTVAREADLQLLSRWREICETQHGAHCKPRQLYDGNQRNVTLRVVDVNRLCVVSLPTNAKYVTLSYVWGGIEQLRLLQANLDSLMQPMSLQAEWDSIPRTITQAIKITRSLGEQYLWVDSLCIVQDDSADLDTQIQHMNIVYGCATLTLVAVAGSNANAGLPGVTAGDRDNPSVDADVQGVRLITALPDFTTALSESIWETRGWTFQEKILSKRLLCFSKDQTFWHCAQATWSEDAVWESWSPYFSLSQSLSLLSPSRNLVPLPSSKLSGLRRYERLVGGYHLRRLSKPTDAQDAFAGALSLIAEEFDTTCVWGLPLAIFEEALLWMSPIHDPSCRRSEFPSWSWLGWEASPLPGDLEFNCANSQHIALYPLVRWRRINTQGELEHLGTQLHARHVGPPPEEGLESYHPAPYGDHALEVRQPVLTLQLPFTHLLCFNTEVAHLRVGRRPLRSPSDFSRYHCRWYVVGVPDPSVRSEEDPAQAGKMSSTSSEGILGLAQVSLQEEWRSRQPDELQFIVVSGQRRASAWDAGSVAEGANLMLVETIEGISYRVQLIRSIVLWDRWAMARPTEQMVTLG